MYGTSNKFNLYQSADLAKQSAPYIHSEYYYNPPCEGESCAIYDTTNRVKNYNSLEKVNEANSVALRQNINGRHVRIENSSLRDVMVGISIDHKKFIPRKNDTYAMFKLRGGEVIDLSVNAPGDRTQYIWLFCPHDGRVLNTPHYMFFHINQYVITQGQNNWWIMDYFRPGRNAQK